MRGMTISQRRQAPNRFASSASFTRSRSASTPRWPSSLEMPALFTRISSRPNSSSIECESRSTLSGSPTSSCRTITPPRSPAAAALPCSPSREPMTTVIPRSGSCLQTSTPIPRFPPLTSATRLFSIVRPPYLVYHLRPRIAHARLSADKPERSLYSHERRWRHAHMLSEIPAFKDHHGPPDLPGKPDLRERTVLAADGDDNVS